MKNRTILFVATSIILIIVLYVLYYIPSVQVFGDLNPYWNGLSLLKSKLNATRLTAYSYLPTLGQDYALIIIGPQKPFHTEEVASIEQFLNNGGLLILADNFGTGNQLINSLGLDARFGNQTLNDPVFNFGNPLILYAFSSIKNIKNLTLYYSTYLMLGSNYNLIASTSIFSYIKVNNTSEKFGPFPVIASIAYGKGKVILIASPYIWVNSFIDKGENEKLLYFLIQNRTAILDVSHWEADLLTSLKEYEYLLYSTISTSLIKYIILAGCVAFIFLSKIEEVKMFAKSNELERIIKENPDWNVDLLRKIKEEREKYGSE
jgi:hypothetical protein